MIDPHIQLTVDNLKRPCDIYGSGYRDLLHLYTRASWQHKDHCFSWLGVPILQTAQDLLHLQYLIWNSKANMVIETGTWCGGSAVYFASVLRSCTNCGHVISIDHDWEEFQVDRFPWWWQEHIHFVHGDSVDLAIVNKVLELDNDLDTYRGRKGLVVLDSNHSRAHVTKELNAYSRFVSLGSYLVVMDTALEILHDAPDGRAEWLHDNPAAAVREFLLKNRDFVVEPDPKGVTNCPGGVLRRVR